MSEDARATLLPPPIEDLSVLFKAAEAQLTPAQREMQELHAGSTNTEQAERTRLMKRPYIRHLEPAVSPSGELLAKEGETVIVDRRCTLLPGAPWLDTRTLVIKRVWPEEGRVRGFDDALKHFVTFGYGAEHLTDVRLLPKKTTANPFKVPAAHRKRQLEFMKETLGDLWQGDTTAPEGTAANSADLGLNLPEGQRVRGAKRRKKKGHSDRISAKAKREILESVRKK